MGEELGETSASVMESVENRLRGEVEGLNEISSAADLAAIKKVPLNTPAAYVLLESESAAANTAAAGGHIQRVTSNVAIVLAHKSGGDARGGGSTRELEWLKDRILSRVVGWNDFSYSGSRLLGLIDGIVWEQLNFTHDRHLRIVE